MVRNISQQVGRFWWPISTTFVLVRVCERSQIENGGGGGLAQKQNGWKNKIHVRLQSGCVFSVDRVFFYCTVSVITSTTTTTAAAARATSGTHARAHMTAAAAAEISEKAWTIAAAAAAAGGIDGTRKLATTGRKFSPSSLHLYLAFILLFRILSSSSSPSFPFLSNNF